MLLDTKTASQPSTSRGPRLPLLGSACGLETFHGWSVLVSICNLTLGFLRILSSAQFFSKRLQEVPSFLETSRLVRWDLPWKNPVRADFCSPRPEIFCCKLTLFNISPPDFLGSAGVFLRSSEFCRTLLETARPALCSFVNSLLPVLKAAAARFHESLVSPGAPLGSLNGILR